MEILKIQASKKEIKAPLTPSAIGKHTLASLLPGLLALSAYVSLLFFFFLTRLFGAVLYLIFSRNHCK